MVYEKPNNCHTYVKQIPEGDDKERDVCIKCGFINYLNPKVVVGAVSTWGNKILLVKRAIEPQKGFWTIPAGFLELDETIEEGAVRETWEEANARIQIDCILGIYNITRISQIYIIFRAKMLTQSFHPGIESQDAKLVSFRNIPWERIAFPSIVWALNDFHESVDKDFFPPKKEPPSFFRER